MNFEKLILSLPQKDQEKYLRESLRENKLDVFFMLSKVLLNVPVSDGGIETETVDLIFKEELENGIQHNKMDIKRAN